VGSILFALFHIVLIALSFGLVLDAYLLDSLLYFSHHTKFLCLIEENIKETKRTGSKNSKEVDQHVVLRTVDQSSGGRGGWQLPVGTAKFSAQGG
jgi:hypothetical protein